MGDSIMPSIIRATTSSGLQIAPDNSGSLQLQTNGTTTALTIDTSQNVGIGTTTPADKFVVAGSGNTVSITDNGSIEIQRASGDAFIDFKASAAVDYDTRIQSLGSGSSASLGFNTNSTERMRIDSSGNVIVGNTSPIADAKLSSTAAGVAFGGSTSGTADFFWVQSNTGGTTSQSIYVMPCRFGSTLTFKGGIYYNGGTGLMEYTGTSDYRIKEDIVDAAAQLDSVSQIKVREFLVKGSTQRVIGFIAHELQECVPVAVTGEKDAVDENGEPILQTVNQQALIPILVKAIQEQQTIINDLKARIETLEAK